MKPEFRDDKYKGKPIDSKEFDLFEEQTGYKLPESYKEFLLEQDGGHLVETKGDDDEYYLGVSFEHYDGEKDYATIDQFRALNKFKGEEYFFIDDNKSSWDPKFFGQYISGQLIIGSDRSNGYPVTISLGKDGYGEIYFWDCGASYNEDTKKNRAKIADSFEEFINKFEYREI